MVDSTLTGLSSLGTISSDDLTYVVDNPSGNPASYKAAFSTIKTFMFGDALAEPFNLDYVGEIFWTTDTKDNIFHQYMQEGNFGGEMDPVFYWGWNVDGGGVRLDNTLPAIWQQFEADYLSGGVHYQEWNMNSYDTAGNLQRYMSFLQNIANYRDAYWRFWIGDQVHTEFSVGRAVDDTTVFRVLSSGTIWMYNMTFYAAPLIQINGGGIVTVLNDWLWQTNTTGPILADRSDGHTYRIKVTNGVLGTEVYT